MSPKPELTDTDRLRHMHDAANAAMGFVQGRTRGDLDTDLMLQFALVRALEVVGEAADELSDSTHAAHPSISWSDIIGMRHRLIHGYFGQAAEDALSPRPIARPATRLERERRSRPGTARSRRRPDRREEVGGPTTAYVAEQWGRRWITIDTGRVALALARTRLMSAKYPYYLFADSTDGLRKEAERAGQEPPSSESSKTSRKMF
jgi:uncharacterized protein with HEPN domain